VPAVEQARCGENDFSSRQGQAIKSWASQSPNLARQDRRTGEGRMVKLSHNNVAKVCRRKVTHDQGDMAF
jgi:hypothetical protein